MPEGKGATRDIRERCFAYALRSVRVFQALRKERDSAGHVIGKQFLRAATSVGANVEEAQSAESRLDFIHKMTIAQKEARESLYWLRLLRESGLLAEARLAPLLREAEEVVRVLTAILVSTKSSRSRARSNARS